MTDSARRHAALWALGGLALLVGHDAVYLAHIGPGRQVAEMLRTAGHGYWGIASLVLVAAAVLAAIGVAIRVVGLRRHAASLAAVPSARHRGARARFLRTWAVYGTVLAVAFVLQENAEHLAAHGHAPGIGVLLGPEHPLALPVLGCVAALAAAIATLVGDAHGALVAAISAAMRRLARAPRITQRPPSRLIAAFAPVLSSPGAGRAPPLAHSSHV